MPSHAQGRRGRRGVAWALSVATALSVIGLAAPSYATGDDYPYAHLGRCPLVPLAPKAPDKPGQPGKPGHPGMPGQPARPGKPGAPGQATHPTQPPKPPPPRVCAKHIWFYNGSYGDPWGFALRNCTSFVAWRLRTTNGLSDFENHFGGVHWGNAAHWDEAAGELGYLVDDVPAVGAVAQTDAGRVGHVAWVSAVGDGTVTIEEYNFGVAGGYGVRTVPTSSFRYLHLEDTAPAPFLGSTRAGVATADARGGTWSALTTHTGHLVVRRPSGHVVHLETQTGWSPDAAPAVVTDTQGRVWLAAVTRAGRVLTAHTPAGSTAFSRPRPVLRSATTASPALAVDADGRVRMFAVSASGTLMERHARASHPGSWSHPRRLGQPGSWSTHASPSTATDAAGRVWLAAVTRHGRLFARHGVRHEVGWTAFHLVDHRPWSVTSTPALTDAPDGRVWLAGVGPRGDLVVRHTDPRGGHWQHPDRLAGTWSPYSSPALTVDPDGRAWLAAVGTDGDVSVRSRPLGAHAWHRSGRLPHGHGSETRSPGLTSTVGGVLVAVRGDHGRAVWRRPQGPADLPPAHGPRGGGRLVSRFL
jgi:surface antigen